MRIVVAAVAVVLLCLATRTESSPAKLSNSPASVRTWIYVHGSKTHTFVRREGHMWAVYTSGKGGPCWIGRGPRGYTFMWFGGLSGPEFLSYAVPGIAGVWRFVDETNTARVLGFAHPRDGTTWDVLDRRHVPVAVARGPDGVVGAFAWMTLRTITARLGSDC